MSQRTPPNDASSSSASTSPFVRVKRDRSLSSEYPSDTDHIRLGKDVDNASAPPDHAPTPRRKQQKKLTSFFTSSSTMPAATSQTASSEQTSSRGGRGGRGSRGRGARASRTRAEQPAPQHSSSKLPPKSDADEPWGKKPKRSVKSLMKVDPEEAAQEEEEAAHRGPRKRTRSIGNEFSNPLLHVRFERYVSSAQDAFLHGDIGTAEAMASKALAIRATAHLFALLAVIADSRGQFERASDFRLLQAFLARDRVLWEELLHDFLQQQLYYKSVVCLQRLSSLEPRNSEHYRTLQLQLADLLVGLGEIRRAANVLLPLWEHSDFQDFDVFAQLSGLYFQLGKWVALENLIAMSLKHFGVVVRRGDGTEGVGNSFEISVATPQRAELSADGEGEGGGTEGKKRRRQHRRNNKITFADEDKDEVKDGGEDRGAPSGESALSAGHPPSSPPTASQALEELRRPSKRKGFLTLLNVHTELLNERGNFMDTIQLVRFAAASLDLKDLLELPPDVLFRYCTACAFVGGAQEQPCREVFNHLLSTCSMEQYADVLMDTASNLTKAGLYDLAEKMYVVFTRYYRFELRQQEKELEERHAALVPARERWEKLVAQCQQATAHQAAKGLTEEPGQTLGTILTLSERDEWVSQLTQCRQQLQVVWHRSQEQERLCQDLRLILAEALYGQALCSKNLNVFDMTEAAALAKEVLEVHPLHLNARILLGKYYFYDQNNARAAIEMLTPFPEEPALHRVQLGAVSVTILRRSEQYQLAIHVGVMVFNLLLSTNDDGDVESVAPGSASSRRSMSIRLPTLSRASSAIVPASSLSNMLHGPQSAGTANTSTPGLLVARSVASSIRSGTSVFRQLLDRRGATALTTTVFGASAAHSIATGWEREVEEAQLQDSSTIFKFSKHRTGGRKKDPNEKTKKPNGKQTEEERAAERTSAESGEAEVVAQRTDTEEEEEEEEERPTATATNKEETQDRRAALGFAEAEALRKRRREAVEQLPASAFWGEEESKEAETNANEDQTAATASGAQKNTETEPSGGGEGETATRSSSDPRRPERRKDKVPALPPIANMTSYDERERDLAELEAVAEEEGRATVTGEANENLLLDEDEEDEPQGPPSMEELMERFHDPVMAQLFLEATTSSWDSSQLHHDPLHPEPRPHASAQQQQQWSLTGDPLLASLLLLPPELQDAGVPTSPTSASSPEVAGGNSSLTLRHRSGLSVAADVGADSVTLKEVVEALGSHRLFDLANDVMECYRVLGRLSEAKEFASIALLRLTPRRVTDQFRRSLSRPMGLALMRAAIGAGDTSEALRVGLRLVSELEQEYTGSSSTSPPSSSSRYASRSAHRPEAVEGRSTSRTESDGALESSQEWAEVVELLHGMHSMRDDRTQLLRRRIAEGQHRPSVLLLLGNRYFISRSYRQALHVYLVALQHAPQNLLLLFLTGLSYLLSSHHKRVPTPEGFITVGLYYLGRYRDTLLKSIAEKRVEGWRCGELVYNLARVFHFLHQPSLAIPLYERVAYDLPVPESCSKPLRRAARFNLYFYYRWGAGEDEVALQSL